MGAAFIKIHGDSEAFGRLMVDYAAAAVRGFNIVFRDECRELAGEMSRRTPPFSGRALREMLDASDQRRQIAQATKMGPFTSQSKFKDDKIENMGALAIGKRRVERDIRRVVYGMRGAEMPQRQTATQVFKGQDSHHSYHMESIEDWGAYQKCERQDAIRLFATKSGEVYGIDFQRFKPWATLKEIATTHQEHRGKRGRVTTAGSKDRVVGRWRWLNVLVTKAEAVNAYVKAKQVMVGQAKGGWGAAFLALGGQLSAKGWVGRHAHGNGVPKAGDCEQSLGGTNISITIINRSAWASGGDPDKVMDKSVQGRCRVLAIKTRNVLEGVWGNKARLHAQPNKH